MPPQREPGSAIGWVLGGVAVLVVIFGLALLLDLGPFASDETSRGEFVAAADGICKEAHDAFLELQGEPPRTGREAEDLTGKLADIARDEREQIAALNGPPELDPLVEQYLEAREKGIDALENGVDAAGADDSFAYTANQAELADSQLERQQIAKRIGLSECSRPLEGRSALEGDAESPQAIDPQAPPTVEGEIGE